MAAILVASLSALDQNAKISPQRCSPSKGDSKKKRDPGFIATASTLTVQQLVFQFTDGMQRAIEALLGVYQIQAICTPDKSLREDAAQLREFRGDILDYVLETWRDVETDEADDLRAKRRAQERREQEADLASIAKAQVRLKSGKLPPITGRSKTSKNAKSKEDTLQPRR